VRDVLHAMRIPRRTFVVAELLAMWIAHSAMADGIIWSDLAGIGGANLDGTDVNQSFIPVQAGILPGLAVGPVVVPEPATGLLVMGGVLGLALAHRKAGVGAVSAP